MAGLAVTELGARAELLELPRPRPARDEVLVETRYSGVSVGTEMWIASGRRADYGEPPFVNGYQATGRVVEVGPDVGEVEEGDLVALFCRGAHSQYVKAKEELVHKIGDDIVREAALFVQPSVGANALNLAGVNTGDVVLIVGQGLIGQCTAMLARLRGAYVVATDVSPERLRVSEGFCADWVIDAGEADLPEEVRGRFPGGVDVVAESTGFQALLDDAMRCCKRHGRFVFEGWYPDEVSYTFQIAHERELSAFYPVFIGPRPTREGILRMMASGALDTRPLISHGVSWEESAGVYNELFTSERDRFNGIVIDWSPDGISQRPELATRPAVSQPAEREVIRSKEHLHS